jgi:hypothetical protein
MKCTVSSVVRPASIPVVFIIYMKISTNVSPHRFANVSPHTCLQGQRNSSFIMAIYQIAPTWSISSPRFNQPKYTILVHNPTSKSLLRWQNILVMSTGLALSACSTQSELVDSRNMFDSTKHLRLSCTVR